MRAHGPGGYAPCAPAVCQQIGCAFLGAPHLLDAHIFVPGCSRSGSGGRHGVPPHPPAHRILHPQTHLRATDAGLERLPRGECCPVQPQLQAQVWVQLHAPQKLTEMSSDAECSGAGGGTG